MKGEKINWNCRRFWMWSIGNANDCYTNGYKESNKSINDNEINSHLFRLNILDKSYQLFVRLNQLI